MSALPSGPTIHRVIVRCRVEDEEAPLALGTYLTAKPPWCKGTVKEPVVEPELWSALEPSVKRDSVKQCIIDLSGEAVHRWAGWTQCPLRRALRDAQTLTILRPLSGGSSDRSASRSQAFLYQEAPASAMESGLAISTERNTFFAGVQLHDTETCETSYYHATNCLKLLAFLMLGDAITQCSDDEVCTWARTRQESRGGLDTSASYGGAHPGDEDPKYSLAAWLKDNGHAGTLDAAERLVAKHLRFISYEDFTQINAGLLLSDYTADMEVREGYRSIVDTIS